MGDNFLHQPADIEAGNDFDDLSQDETEEMMNLVIGTADGTEFEDLFPIANDDNDLLPMDDFHVVEVRDSDVAIVLNAIQVDTEELDASQDDSMVLDEDPVTPGHGLTRPWGRQKQPQMQTCITCQSKVEHMRNHLVKAHDMRADFRKYILSYYTTRGCKKVFECKECFNRFTNPRRHAIKFPLHAVHRVSEPNSVEGLHVGVRSTIEKRASGRVMRAVSEFMKYYIERDVKIRTSNAAAKLLYRISVGTDGFKNPERVDAIFRSLKEETGLASSTLYVYSFYIAKFLSFVNLHCRKTIKVDMIQWKTALTDMRTYLSKEGASYQSKKTAERFERVPDSAAIKELVKLTTAKLADNLKDKSLKYKEIVSLTFFLTQAHLNIRPGPITRWTAESLSALTSGDITRSNDHKTGYKYQIAMMIDDDLKPFVVEVMDTYRRTYKKEPRLVFSSRSNKVITTLAAWQDKIFPRLFPDTESASRFSFAPNPVRKWWDTLWENSGRMTGELAAAHESQSGHSAETRKKKYVKPPPTAVFRKLLDTYKAILYSDTPIEKITEHAKARAVDDEENDSDESEDAHETAEDVAETVEDSISPPGEVLSLQTLSLQPGSSQSVDPVPVAANDRPKRQTRPTASKSTDNDEFMPSESEEDEVSSEDDAPKRRKPGKNQTRKATSDKRAVFAAKLLQFRKCKYPLTEDAKAVLQMHVGVDMPPSLPDVRREFITRTRNKKPNEAEVRRVYYKITQTFEDVYE